MSQIQQTSAAAAPTHVRRVAMLGTVAMMIAAVGFAFSLPLGHRGQGTIPAAQQATSRVTDGWMTKFSAANKAHKQFLAENATDGWASRYLIGNGRAGELTDGWASRYLIGNGRAGELTDGWASRYLN